MKKPGFTLIELLVTATIIIVLMGIGVVAFSSTTKSSRDARRKADMEAVRQALVLRKSELGKYADTPTTYTNISSLIGAYISGPAPSNPKTGDTAYDYSGTVDTASFCICAQLESDSPKGNASAANCTSTSWTTNGDYYCVSNP